MKILHTSDWHLGKILHGQSLIEDQRHMLEQVLEELKNGYDALIVAGDIFDRAIPPAPAITLFDEFLVQLCDLGLPVVIIPGNHDSMERLRFGSSLFEQSGIYIRCEYDQFEPVAITDKDGNACDIFTMPFVEQAYVSELLNDASVKDKASAVKALLAGMRDYQRDGVPSVLVAHEFIAGSEESESERVFIGGSHVVHADLFSDFSYVALGHLHKHQATGTETIRYSGSPLAYSFGEAKNENGVLAVEICPEKGTSTKAVRLLPRKPLVVLEDTFEQLLESDTYNRCSGDYISARITDEGHHINLQARLRERFPNLLETRLIAVEKRLEAGAEMVGTGADDPVEVFGAFLDFFQWETGEEREEAEALFVQASEAARQKEVAQ